MKAVVDRDTCIGCGACEGTCPAIFTLDDESKSVAKDIELTGDILQSAQDAEAGCPVSAISIN